MKNKNKKKKFYNIKGIYIFTVLVFIITITNVIAAKSNQNSNSEISEQKSIVSLGVNDNNQSKDNLSFEKEQVDVIKKDNKKQLSKQEVTDLYEKGYEISDIEIAEELSGLCNKTPEEILNIKGKTTYINNEKKDKDGNSIVVPQKVAKTWNSVMEELGLFKAQPLEQLRVSQRDVKAEEKNFWEKNSIMQEGKIDDSNLSVLADKTQDILMKNFNFTEEEIEIGKREGTAKIIEIAEKKGLIKKDNQDIEKVLNIKKAANGEWENVEVNLEVNSNEK
jgi:hypothetical protein